MICRLPILTIAIVLLLSGVASSGQPRPAAADLQGKWALCKPIILRVCDEEVVFAKDQPLVLFAVVKNGGITLSNEGLRDVTVGFQVDSSTTPMRLDLTDLIDDGEGGKLPLKGICRVEGDSLTVSFYWERSEHLREGRPANFDNQQLPTVTLTFKRVVE